MKSIDIHKLRIVRGPNEVLHDVSGSVKAGVLTGLIGPSGSGKTTLMRAIVGVQRINGGELTVLGRAAGSPGLRHEIGYVTQAPAVYGDLTVEQNLRYFSRIIEASKTDVSRVLEVVQLGPQGRQLVDSLSGGQKARVNLAVALLGDPSLLILDEPTVGLDPLLRDELWEVFSRLAHAGKTILVSSHVMDEAERCEELLLMRDGKIIWNDTKEKLLDSTKKATVNEAFVYAIKGTGK